MDNLHVNSKLAAVVVEDEDTNAAATRLKGTTETRPQVGLVNDRQALLDITTLSHGNDVTALKVENTVLLEDRAEHGLDNHTGGGVGDEGRLLVELAGEEVNTKVAVLASGRRGGDADDLARTSLQHQEVTDADVVARDGDSVRQVLSRLGSAAAGSGSRTLADLHVDMLLMAVSARVDNAVSKLVHAMAEGVVVTC